MTKRRDFSGRNQGTLDFDQPIEAYSQLRTDLLREASVPEPPSREKEFRWDEISLELAVALKRAIRASGLSREQVVDAVNDFFDLPKNDGRKGLTIHQLNGYLCKPSDYPLPVPYVHAFCRVTGSLEPLKVLAELEGVRLIDRDEVRKLALGKIDDALAELQRLKKTFRIRTGA